MQKIMKNYKKEKDEFNTDWALKWCRINESVKIKLKKF